MVGEQLFAPYGQARYSASAPTNGGMHTTLGFTGQHADAGYPGASGLDYFGARYLDPVVGRFTSADDANPGLGDPIGMDPYAYVDGMVESATDPTGQAITLTGDAAGAGVAAVGAIGIAIPAVMFPQGMTPLGSPQSSAPGPGDDSGVDQVLATRFITLAGGLTEVVVLYYGRIDETIVNAQGQVVFTATYDPNQAQYVHMQHLFDAQFAGTQSDAMDQAGVRAAEAKAGIPVSGTTGVKPGGGSTGLGGITNLIHVAATLAAALLLASEGKDTSTLQPGPHAGDSIPARGPKSAIGDFTDDERAQIDAIGYATGCHTCGTRNPGTKTGHFIPDHQPCDALNADCGPQRLYPHCLACSNLQGGQVNGIRWMLRSFFPR